MSGEKMKKRLFRTAAVSLTAAVLLSCPCQAVPDLSAKHAVLLDTCSNRVLFEKQAETPALIASTTKIMTGLLVTEQCDLQEQVCVSAEAVGIEGSSLYLKEGEVCSVEELLYGMMLHSGNDAAMALAIHCGGSVEKFVKQMNERACELGLSQTSFANPHGLDSVDNHASALDLAILAQTAMQNPAFYQVVSSKTAEFDSRSFTNHNKLLWRYDGTVGVKTGYTKAAGRILVSCAERDGRRLIAVTIDAPNDWKDHQTLLDYGFEVFSFRKIISDGQIFGSVDVVNGVEPIQVMASEAFYYPLKETERIRLQCSLPEFVFTPVIAGEKAGQVIVLLEENVIARVPLVWRYTVMEGA